MKYTNSKVEISKNLKNQQKYLSTANSAVILFVISIYKFIASSIRRLRATKKMTYKLQSKNRLKFRKIGLNITPAHLQVKFVGSRFRCLEALNID